MFVVLLMMAPLSQKLEPPANPVRFSRFQGKELELFARLLASYDELETSRNLLAHSCFGVSADDQDLLLAIKIDKHVTWQTEIVRKLRNGQAGDDPHIGLKKDMVVYTRSELEQLVERMQNCWRSFFILNGYLREPEHLGTKQEFEFLLQQYEIK